jgi:peptidoglycan lytic transglycosylase G
MRRFMIFLVALVAIAAIAVWLRHELKYPYRGFSQAQVFVEIPHKTSRWGIASRLKESGVVHSRLAFLLLSEWHRRSVLQAGEYMFDHAVTPRQVFDQIAGGRIFVHTVVVPEGWTMFDIARELERQGICSSEDFLKIARDPSLVHDIAPNAPSLEGFLFPASYQFSHFTTPQEIAATMVQHFREEWSKLQAQTASSQTDPAVGARRSRRASASMKEIQEKAKHAAFEPLSITEVVTLASLIERETPQPKERPIVSSVFYNRMKLGLPLQCDPTVQYALDLTGELKRDVTPADLRIPSPYNTYLHRGLPPGPIANPGDASLRAALEPTRTHYLYFVANDAGGHFFSSTLAEHNRNVERYRRMKEGLPPNPPAPKPRAKTSHRTGAKSHRTSRPRMTARKKQ